MKFTEIFKRNQVQNENKEIAIRVNNVTKYFKIYHQKPTTVYERILLGNQRYEKFAALKNINFEINKGEFFGIIGKNGCGKSTLLRIIANILRPSDGSVEVNGNIASILELGVGFNQDLTAEENIRLYASIVGISDKEIKAKINIILRFANLENFRDTKIKHFSSGMYTRLAFTTAVQVNPEILLVDEVLAVGDIEFQQKCFNVFLDFKKKRKTVVFVSHDLNSVRRFCDKVLLIEAGKQIAFGDTNEILEKYIYTIKETKPDVSIEKETKHDEIIEKKIELAPKDIEITKVKFFNKNNDESSIFKTFDIIKIRIFYKSHRIISNPIFGIIIHDEKGNWCIGMNTEVNNINIKNLRGSGYIDLIIPKIPLNKGSYSVSTAIAEKNAITSYDYHDKADAFSIINTLQDYGTFVPDYSWSLDGIIQDDQ
jgi:lipopolysaccharide transport system ATP-binding protein